MVERRKEVLERRNSDPESSPIVTEKIFIERNVVCDRVMVVGDRLSYMQVEPWIFGVIERSNRIIVNSLICEAARDNRTLVFRE